MFDTDTLERQAYRAQAIQTDEREITGEVVRYLSNITNFSKRHIEMLIVDYQLYTFQDAFDCKNVPNEIKFYLGRYYN